MLVFNHVCLALDRQVLIRKATINDSILGNDIELSCLIQMLMYYQACLLLQGQLLMARCIITDNMPGDDIELY